MLSRRPNKIRVGCAAKLSPTRYHVMPSRLKFQTETLPGSAAAYTGGVFSCAFLWRQPSRSGPGRSAIIAVSEHTTDLADRDSRPLVDIEGAAETALGVQPQQRPRWVHRVAADRKRGG